jgi:hypothetical protein
MHSRTAEFTPMDLFFAATLKGMTGPKLLRGRH